MPYCLRRRLVEVDWVSLSLIGRRRSSVMEIRDRPSFDSVIESTDLKGVSTVNARVLLPLSQAPTIAARDDMKAVRWQTS